MPELEILLIKLAEVKALAREIGSGWRRTEREIF
jgi:hypothetical protein